MNIGYKDDKVFLLSKEEYENCASIIQAHCATIKWWWWLRSPGSYQDYAASVSNDGGVIGYGDYVINDYVAVRPAFKMEKTANSIGTHITLPLIPEKHKIASLSICKIAEDNNYDLYLADLSITLMSYDKKSNDYETSDIRKYLKELETDLGL